MAIYTKEVQTICEQYSGITGDGNYGNVAEIISGALSKVFDFEYPIFDENYKSVLETKILKHYYTREIADINVGKWKLWLNTRLNEIMPYYNQLYKSELINIQPLVTSNYNKTHQDSGGDVRTVEEQNGGTINTTSEGTNGGTVNTTVDGSLSRENEKNTAKGGSDTVQFDISRGDTFQTDDKQLVKSNTTNTGVNNDKRSENLKDLYSDTPQGGVKGLESNDYLTNARINTNSINNENNSKNTENSEVNTQVSNKQVRTGQENNNQVNTYGETNNENESVKGTENRQTDVTESRNSTGKVDVTENRKSNVKDSVTTTRQYVESVVGNVSGRSESKLLQEFRETFLNIDMMIIDNLSDLFMRIY